MLFRYRPSRKKNAIFDPLKMDGRADGNQKRVPLFRFLCWCHLRYWLIFSQDASVWPISHRVIFTTHNLIALGVPFARMKNRNDAGKVCSSIQSVVHPGREFQYDIHVAQALLIKLCTMCLVCQVQLAPGAQCKCVVSEQAGVRLWTSRRWIDSEVPSAKWTGTKPNHFVRGSWGLRI